MSAPQSPCAVAALAEQACALSAAFDEADARRTKQAREGDARADWEHTASTIYDRLLAVRSMAATLPTRSAAGALFQVAIVANAVESARSAGGLLAGLLDYSDLNDEARTLFDRYTLRLETAERHALTCLHSLRLWLEREHGAPTPAMAELLDGDLPSRIRLFEAIDEACQVAGK